METQETKLCKHCQTEIPKKAKVCPQCRKKQGGIGKIILIGILAFGLIGSCLGGSDETENSSSSIHTSQNVSVENTEEVSEKVKVEILKEYTLSDGIGWYTRHFMVIQNTSNVTVDVSTSSLAYDKDGNVVSTDDASFEALGAGCISVMYEAFETESEIAYYETTLNVSESRYYESVIEDLSYIQNDIDGGAVFQVTNNGTEPADFVEGYALFFRNGELIGFESNYFTDDDSEIKSGATISKQFNSYENFDTIEFYLTGRR